MKTIPSLLFLGALLSPTWGGAEEVRPAAIVVLDASGSMWGKVDGRAKIEIAREAANAMLDGWDAGTDLGLMVYGHRRKGDCADIELLQAVAPLDATAMRERIAGLQPKGMTPIAESVRQAAIALRNAERKATVILVSDGEETCSADPCAVGAELEASGVDFTVHAIGFDLDDHPKAREQLRCLASATGGRYLDAHDARELSGAMKTVAIAAPAASACGKFVGGDPYMDGMATWPTGGMADEIAADRRRSFDPLELADTASPQECRQLCDGDAACSAWWFEPVGSHFRTQPVCFRWDATVALSPPAPGHEGSAMGLKPEARQIALKAGVTCAEAAAKGGAGIHFNEGCTAYDQEGFAGDRWQMGGETGLRVREMPERWRDAIRSLACQPGCGLLVFTEPGYDGGNFSIPDGSRFERMPEDYQRPFGSYEVGCSAQSGDRP